MKSALSKVQLIVKPSTVHGYGVFAGEDIKKGDIIEECYAVILADQDHSNINDFAFKVQDHSAMVLGNGAIYNHLDENYNADYRFDTERSAMVYSAKQPIKKGEEIFINYGNNWFAAREVVALKPSWRFRIRKFLYSMRNFVRGLLVTSAVILFICMSQIYVLSHG